MCSAKSPLSKSLIICTTGSASVLDLVLHPLFVVTDFDACPGSSGVAAPLAHHTLCSLLGAVLQRIPGVFSVGPLSSASCNHLFEGWSLLECLLPESSVVVWGPAHAVLSFPYSEEVVTDHALLGFPAFPLSSKSLLCATGSAPALDLDLRPLLVITDYDAYPGSPSVAATLAQHTLYSLSGAVLRGISGVFSVGSSSSAGSYPLLLKGCGPLECLLPTSSLLVWGPARAHRKLAHLMTKTPDASMDHELYTVQSPADDTKNGRELTEYVYKMSNDEFVRFVKLRVTNEALFTGKRNSSNLAYRAILKELGLNKEISASQARKKWENLKTKYRDMKNPPPGVSVNPTNWPWFSLMDDAMEGRLAGSEVILDTSSVGNESDYRPNSTSRKRTKRPRELDQNEIELSVEEDDMMSEEMQQGKSELDRDRDEMEHERAIIDSDKAAIEYEKMVLEREKMVLDREKAGVERELAALDRDRASLEREKAAVERDRASVEYIRAQLEKERAILERERAKLERERAVLEHRGTETTEHTANLNDNFEGTNSSVPLVMEPATLDRRQKFLNLFEKLIENF
ncbi:hypothetical protein DNTS_006494 [Danionella cerebrum]|uniref:Myb/SANT-like DNA-binding domain-containing protein n=1 Tax=Danionella cerebrum TaxID=2873325 RepID=A0A553QK62_9TELE|nr:hypothetical protein DNTS_006494 [Danionella translucida]